VAAFGCVTVPVPENAKPQFISHSIRDEGAMLHLKPSAVLLFIIWVAWVPFKLARDESGKPLFRDFTA
jgi:hypothetical protein